MLQVSLKPLSNLCKALHFRIVVMLLTIFCNLMPAQSHETRPAIADITLLESEVQLIIQFNAELFLANIDASQFANTDYSPGADLYGQFRQLEVQDLRAAFKQKWPAFSDLLYSQVENSSLKFKLIDMYSETDISADLPRLSTLTISAQPPIGYSSIQFGWHAQLGDLILRQMANSSIDSNMLFTGYVKPGSLSPVIQRHGKVAPSLLNFLAEYIKIGFIHILPLGFDHILFVLGLFFFVARWQSVLAQITVFTIAHSLTLVSAVAGFVSLPANLVEPLIAASIAYVAIENVLRKTFHKSRLLVIFIFGLLHGLGFAAILSDIGFPQSKFLISLISFNIGIELGQISVVAVTFIIVSLIPVSAKDYRRLIAVPSSCIIGVIGLWMIFTRLVIIWL